MKKIILITAFILFANLAISQCDNYSNLLTAGLNKTVFFDANNGFVFGQESTPEVPQPTIENTATLPPTLTPPFPTATSTGEPLPPEPQLSLIGSDTFESGDFAAWSFGPGWGRIPHAEGQAIQVFNTLIASCFYEPSSPLNPLSIS